MHSTPAERPSVSRWEIYEVKASRARSSLDSAKAWGRDKRPIGQILVIGLEVKPTGRAGTAISPSTQPRALSHPIALWPKGGPVTLSAARRRWRLAQAEK